MPSLPFRTRSSQATQSGPATTSLPPTVSNSAAQAGGGIPPQLFPAAHEIQEFQPILADYGRIVEKELAERYDLSTPTGFNEFVAREQHQDNADWNVWAGKKEAPNRFLGFLAQGTSDALAPPDLEQSLDLPMSNYFVSSSHNTYLRGHQLYGEASTDPYKNVLLRGCRCVEIDVWDGQPDSEDEGEESGDSKKHGLRGLRERLQSKLGHKKASEEPAPAPKKETPTSDTITPWTTRSSHPEPQVLHGHTLTKKIPFREVCEVIRDYAFVTSDLPVIISLEVHTCAEQQQLMVDIMEECWKGMLVDIPSSESGSGNDNVALPSPQQLRKKILIKVKYSSPKAPPPAAGPVNALAKKPTNLSASSSEEEVAAKEHPEKKKSKIIEALSCLGFYTRSVHFKSFDQPEASIPTHIFSLSESTLMEVHQTKPSELFKHNKSFLMRAYPKGTRIGSSNLDPSQFWLQGVQIVALNWQRWDAGTMLNEAMFAGYAGWILKPAGYRSDSPAERVGHAATQGLLDVSVEVFAGQDIPLPLEHEATKTLKPLVKVEIHAGQRTEARGDNGNGKTKELDSKRHTKTSKTQNPDFKREVLMFDKVTNVIPELSFIRFKVMHDALGANDLAAWACIRLDRLRQGYRLVHLYDANGMQSKGVLFVKISMFFTPLTT